MLLEKCFGYFIGQLERFDIKFSVGTADEYLRRPVDKAIQIRQGHAKVILHSSATQWTASGGLDRDRLFLKGLMFKAGKPVDGIFEGAGDGPIVFWTHDDHAVGGSYAEGVDGVGKASLALDVCI
jgi:hypothetical protein